MTSSCKLNFLASNFANGNNNRHPVTSSVCWIIWSFCIGDEDPLFIFYHTLYCRLRVKDTSHDDVMKWKHFPRYLPFVRGIHRSPVNSPHKSQWRGALMFSLICVWINGWINTREADDLRRYRVHCDVAVMVLDFAYIWKFICGAGLGNMAATHLMITYGYGHEW